MMSRLVDFALDKRFLILGLALLLFVWGMISFHDLPIEAYPDVANNYVNVITQWPGRAAPPKRSSSRSRSRSRR